MSESRASAGNGRPEPGVGHPSTPIGPKRHEPERHEDARPPFDAGGHPAEAPIASFEGRVLRAAPRDPLGPTAGAPSACPAAPAAPAAGSVAPPPLRRPAPRPAPGADERDRPRRILVIKLGALGDVVLAFGPFAAIRAHHPDARITLLTTAPFAELARRSPWFDAVEVDARPRWWNLRGLRDLRRTLRGYDFVYDLQTSGRSSRYFRLAGRPPWSGIARGASHPHANPDRDAMHTVERQREQLRAAGIARVPAPDLSWLIAGGPALPAPYALLVPGAAPHRPAKRWPAERFGQLAVLLAERGLRPVVAGTAAEAPLAAAILAACPRAEDLTGRTSLFDLAGVAARASLAVGNDTGPMHLAAAVGCPCVVLFSRESDPALTAPRGRVQVLRAPHLAGLPVARVAAALP